MEKQEQLFKELKVEEPDLAKPIQPVEKPMKFKVIKLRKISNKENHTSKDNQTTVQNNSTTLITKPIEKKIESNQTSEVLN